MSILVIRGGIIMLVQNKAALEELLRLENKIIDKYQAYKSQVESGEMRKMCEDIINKHNLHIETLQKYVER